MGRMGKAILGALLAVGLLAGEASAAATWATVKNSDCTGLRAATTTAIIATVATTQATTAAMCCTGVGTGFCNRRNNFGDLFEIMATFTAVSSGVYTTAALGDSISLAEFQETGLGQLVYAECQLATNSSGSGTTAATNAIFPVAVRVTPSSSVGPLAIKLFTASAAGVAAGTEETGVSIAGLTIQCLLFGYGA